MAIFGWKKAPDPSDPQKPAKPGEASATSPPSPSSAGAAKPAAAGAAPPAEAKPAPDAKPAKADPGKIEFSPEKARRFFHHAQVAHDSGNLEYAITCWLQGLRFEPSNKEGLENFFRSAAAFGKAPPKDVLKVVSGSTDLDRWLLNVLNWGCKPLDVEHAVRAGLGATDLNLRDPAGFILPRALELVMREKRPRKDHLVRLMQGFEKLEMYEPAVRAGDAAVKLDPGDIRLAADVKNLAAQGTMSRGGYENTGQAGGFRGNIRDLDKQRQLDEQDRLVKSEATLDRLIDAARQEVAANAADRPAIGRLVKLLLERGTPADEQDAIRILDAAYASTQEFRFRQTAGELRLRQAKRNLRPLEQAHLANPADATARAAFESAARAVLNAEIAEYEARVAAYPTDLTLKFELGKRYGEAGRHEEAISMLQLAKSDGRYRGPASVALGRTFLAIGFSDEAIETFRAALEQHPDPSDAQGLDIRYGLLCALEKHAEEARDVASAEEALKLAKAIVVQNIGFRDIRQRREVIQALVNQLKQGA